MNARRIDVPVYITGISHEYPAHAILQHEFESIMRSLYPACSESIGLQKLMRFNERTGIDLRRTIQDQHNWTDNDATPPRIDELSRLFRTAGVELTLSACRRALAEANLLSREITHIVAVTCTDQGNPGFDLLVSQALGLDPTVERTLLHGVGCAGGLSTLRVASNLVAAATQRGEAARILVVSCELCSLFLRAELKAASEDDELHIAPALFSDAAAAVVVCNRLALRHSQQPIFEIQVSGTMVVPDTTNQMSYDIRTNGMIATIGKDVPKTAVGAIPLLFNKLYHTTVRSKTEAGNQPDPSLFDWAIHPGGAAILRGAQKAMSLTDDHIGASLDVYKSRGNSSSATVLIVLDKLRGMRNGREHVVATSFGPGITAEMILMRRHQFPDLALYSNPAKRETRHPWLSIHPRLRRACARLFARHANGKETQKLRPLIQQSNV